MASDNRVIAGMLVAGALGDQSGPLQAAERDDTARWIVEAYRAILRELDASEPEEETNSLGFNSR